MKLSIITVNLNNRDGLKRTIDSVVSQTFTDYEWIVIDGGSNDGSRELIEQYSDHFAYWCSEPDKGIYNAMNKGIAHAKGEWLQFLNSGDWLYEDTIFEKVFSREYDADVVYGDVALINPNTLTISHIEKEPEQINLKYLYSHTLCHQSSFYKNTVFKQYKYNENYRICSDWELYLILLANNYKFQHIPFIMVNYVLGGTCDQNPELNMSERVSVLEKYIPNNLINDYYKGKLANQKEILYKQHRSIRTVAKCNNIIIAFLIKIIYFFEKKPK